MGNPAAEPAAFIPELTPEKLTLGAARLLLQQDLWGRATMPHRTLGWLSLLGSLCLAAGGGYTEDGVPSGPEEPAAARVLARTCDLLAAQLGEADAMVGPSGVQRLAELSQVTTDDSVYVQRLLATVHGVIPAHR
jgi:hypothetical protein